MPDFSAKKEITIDDLAAMCMREFTSIREIMATKADIMHMATKADIKNLEMRLEAKIAEKADAKDVANKDDIARLEKRFDRLETILADHTFRIGRLEKSAKMAG